MYRAGSLAESVVSNLVAHTRPARFALQSLPAGGMRLETAVGLMRHGCCQLPDYHRLHLKFCNLWENSATFHSVIS